ncbi:MAG: hypothetical protein K0S78_3129, partial [Thermomicrobiales bacterium]|nr:hypothetical protein [Thermomicrobiales bacterium]
MAVSSATMGSPPITPSPHHPITQRPSVWRQVRKQWSAYLFLAPTMIL